MIAPIEFPVPRTQARREPRTTARTERPRRAAKPPVSRDIEDEKRHADELAKRDRELAELARTLSGTDQADILAQAGRTEVRYKFHHKQSHPYEVAVFEDRDVYWRVLLPKGFYINLRKTDIVRIEPVGRVTGYRTWVDKTGQYSTVAKYVRYEQPLVQLSKPDGQLLSLAPDALAEADFGALKQLVLGCGKSPADPRYFRSKWIDQVAVVTDVCAIKRATEWTVTAEVEKTTGGNERIDDVWKYPIETTVSVLSYAETRDDAVRSLFESNFPLSDWDEIDSTEYGTVRSAFQSSFK